VTQGDKDFLEILQLRQTYPAKSWFYFRIVKFGTWQTRWYAGLVRLDLFRLGGGGYKKGIFFKEEIYGWHLVASVPYGTKVSLEVIKALDKIPLKEPSWSEIWFSTKNKTKDCYEEVQGFLKSKACDLFWLVNCHCSAFFSFDSTLSGTLWLTKALLHLHIIRSWVDVVLGHCLWVLAWACFCCRQSHDVEIVRDLWQMPLLPLNFREIWRREATFLWSYEGWEG